MITLNVNPAASAANSRQIPTINYENSTFLYNKHLIVI